MITANKNPAARPDFLYSFMSTRAFNARRLSLFLSCLFNSFLDFLDLLFSLVASLFRDLSIRFLSFLDFFFSRLGSVFRSFLCDISRIDYVSEIISCAAAICSLILVSSSVDILEIF